MLKEAYNKEKLSTGNCEQDSGGEVGGLKKLGRDRIRERIEAGFLSSEDKTGYGA